MDSPDPSCDSFEQSDSRTDSMGSDLEVPTSVMQSGAENGVNYGKNGREDVALGVKFAAIDREISKNSQEAETKATRRPRCQFVITGLEKFFYW